MSEIRAKAGVPVADDFMGLGAPTVCAPAVVDSTTGFLYTLKTGDVVVLAAGGGTGTVTSVAQSFTGGIVSVGGSPVTSAGTLALTIAGTSGGVVYFSSSTAWASSGALAASALVLGGGAGNPPATTTTGTGVVTALGVNVGSAGAFVTFNGALGTPSSGTGTNITGVNAATLGGATFAAPAAIGSGTPAAGSFTTLSATGTITPSQTNGIVGTTTNNNANGGSMGEQLESEVLVASAVALTSTVSKDVTTITLTAGDWDVGGNVWTNIGGTLTSVEASISTVSNTLPTRPGKGSQVKWDGSTTGNIGMAVGATRQLVSGNTPVYLVINSTFTVSNGAYGFMWARRRR